MLRIQTWLAGVKGLELKIVSASTGVPVPTLQAIKYKVTKDPRFSTVIKIKQYMDQLGIN